MSTYGPYTPAGFVPFTGFSPTLGIGDAVSPVTSGVVQFNGLTQDDARINRLLYENRVNRRIIATLLGVAPGSTATETKARVQAQQSTFSPNDNGGAVPIEQFSLINRVTTAADLTAIAAGLNRSFAPPTYYADVSGNGGGGHLGY
jgi:hypothetical protein